MNEHITSAHQLRSLIRSGAWKQPTAGLLPGVQQANFVALPQADAFEFLLFCVRNPQVCPIIHVSEPGDPIVSLESGDADVRTDIAKYRVWRDGELVAEPHDVSEYWSDDLVGFLLGCSHTFEGPMLDAGLPLRVSAESPAPPVYLTDRETVSAGRVAGPLVVSMRSFPAELVDEVTALTSRFPTGHGAPVHIGDPAELGIADLATPDFGPAPEVHADEVPMFWACGVTPQLVLPHLRSHTLITHAAGHMFVFDHRVTPAR
ncbi:putative hydro-lyase [Leucobacter japonicus]|uniref:putative hydro-lyase n=1 Tax=Leucobacter japonicus TaxID=1461259 RepID=UPI0006A7C6B5|nr:putative hydro-lyase [Leucobacter japonicus]